MPEVPLLLCRMVARPAGLVAASAALALALVGIGWLDHAATRHELMQITRGLAASLGDTVAAAARVNRAAMREAESELAERLLDNVRLLVELDRASLVTPALIEDLVARNRLFRVTVVGPGGERELQAGAPGGGRGPGAGVPGGGELLDDLLSGRRAEGGDGRARGSRARRGGGAATRPARRGRTPDQRRRHPHQRRRQRPAGAAATVVPRSPPAGSGGHDRRRGLRRLRDRWDPIHPRLGTGRCRRGRSRLRDRAGWRLSRRPHGHPYSRTPDGCGRTGSGPNRDRSHRRRAPGARDTQDHRARRGHLGAAHARHGSRSARSRRAAPRRATRRLALGFCGSRRPDCRPGLAPAAVWRPVGCAPPGPGGAPPARPAGRHGRDGGHRGPRDSQPAQRHRDERPAPAARGGGRRKRLRRRGARPRRHHSRRGASHRRQARRVPACRPPGASRRAQRIPRRSRRGGRREPPRPGRGARRAPRRRRLPGRRGHDRPGAARAGPRQPAAQRPRRDPSGWHGRGDRRNPARGTCRHGHRHGPRHRRRAPAQGLRPYFTTKPDGTGVGLAVVHQVVTSHGGTVDIASEVGRGTRVTITLPDLRDSPR